MFLEILFAILLGVVAGCFTGLVPGIHTNLIAVILVSFTIDVSNEFFVAVICAMTITHSFISTIPSILLGAPEGGTALSVLPGHKLLLEGRGIEAVFYTYFGSAISLVASFFCIYLMKVFLSNFYEVIQQYIGYLLIGVLIFIVFLNTDKKRTLIVIILSGVIGYFVLDSRLENGLFSLLTGFFGVSTLVFSLKSSGEFPKQEFNGFNLKLSKTINTSLFGLTIGFFTSILPGMGSSTGATIGSVIKKESKPEDFLVMIGSITTVNFFSSIIALDVINRARNGSIVALRDLFGQNYIDIMIYSSLISGGMALLLGIRLVYLMVRVISKINYQKLCISIIIILFLLGFFLSGLVGVYIIFICFLVGFYANYFGISRNSMMSCIIVPVMFYFIF